MSHLSPAGNHLRFIIVIVITTKKKATNDLSSTVHANKLTINIKWDLSQRSIIPRQWTAWWPGYGRSGLTRRGGAAPTALHPPASVLYPRSN